MKWINVKDELPKNDTDCIVWIGDTFTETIFNSAYFKENGNKFILYENGGEYETDYTKDVTHWFIPINPNINKYCINCNKENDAINHTKCVNCLSIDYRL